MSAPLDLQNILQHSRCIFTAEEIEAALNRLANSLQVALEHKNPIFLCAMNGALIFMGHLVTKLNFLLQMDYVHLKRYENNRPGESVEWLSSPHLSLKGRHVVIVEDILDSGLTLQAVEEYCYAQKAAQVYTLVLLDKPSGRMPGGLASADFVGLTVKENLFLYGFGLDYDHYLRNLPAIYALNEDFF